MKPLMITETTVRARDVPGGSEWLVDAFGCSPDRLRSLATLQQLIEEVVTELGLHPLAEPLWRVFPGQGGVSGILLLSESHLACHTFPERGLAAFNLYCCRERNSWPWAERLAEALGAQATTITVIDRGQRCPLSPEPVGSHAQAPG